MNDLCIYDDENLGRDVSNIVRLVMEMLENANLTPQQLRIKNLQKRIKNFRQMIKINNIANKNLRKQIENNKSALQRNPKNKNLKNIIDSAYMSIANHNIESEGFKRSIAGINIQIENIKKNEDF